MIKDSAPGDRRQFLRESVGNLFERNSGHRGVMIQQRYPAAGSGGMASRPAAAASASAVRR
jgi:hypothetical protein